MSLPDDITKALRIEPWDRARRRPLELFMAEHGEQKLREHLAASHDRCSSCWAPTGEPHAAVCPNRPDGEDPLLPSQDEALF